MNSHYLYDFFISHASEDKPQFVRALADALVEEGCRVWYDDFEVQVGDSIRSKIDEGLAQSKYGVVVLSAAFFKKPWPKKELGALFASDDSRRILPIWYQVSEKDVRSYSPLLLDIKALRADRPVSEIARDLQAFVLRDFIPEHEFGQNVRSEKFEPRSRDNPDLKVAMARHFSATMTTSLVRHKIFDLFIESGSTLSYVANDLLRMLRGPWVRSLGQTWTIRTNSVFIASALVSDERLANVRLEVLPGAVDQRYGATIPEGKSPEDVEHAIADYLTSSGPGVCLMTSSGMFANTECRLAGPWIGSTHFRAVKRGMFRSQRPIVLFSDETKFDRPFEAGRTISLFESKHAWLETCATVPVAFCIASRSERKRSEIVRSLEAWGVSPYNIWSEVDNCYVALMAGPLFPDLLLGPNNK